MKEQDNVIEKELNKMEISNLPDKELKVLIIKIFNRLERMNELSEKFNKYIENIKKNQSELKK